MTLRNNLKKISLCNFSTFIYGLFNDVCFRGVSLNLQTKEIKYKISMNESMSLTIKTQDLFLYEK